MRPNPSIRLTPERCLFQDRQSATKSEYFDGDIFAMAGASREHDRISANRVGVGEGEVDGSRAGSIGDVERALEVATPLEAAFDRKPDRS